MRQIFGAKPADDRLWVRSQVSAEENGANLGRKFSAISEDCSESRHSEPWYLEREPVATAAEDAECHCY
jgi:hypothetical protein